MRNVEKGWGEGGSDEAKTKREIWALKCSYVIQAIHSDLLPESHGSEIHIYMCSAIHVCIYIYIYSYTHMHVYICICIYIYIYLYVYIYMYIYTYIYMYIHVCVYVSVSVCIYMCLYLYNTCLHL